MSALTSAMGVGPAHRADVIYHVTILAVLAVGADRRVALARDLR